MNQEDDKLKKLLGFEIHQLKEELNTRGVSLHPTRFGYFKSNIADMGGNNELTEYSSKSIHEALLLKEKALYGDDNRKDLIEVVDQNVIDNANSVVSLFFASRIKDNGNGNSTLQVGIFGKLNNLCPEEPFFNQPIGAFCSGFLVAPDIIATAGHCVNEKNVKSIRFVFGFKAELGSAANITINNKDIYSGLEVIGWKQTNQGDWCLLRLDRNVMDRKVLNLRRDGKIVDGQAVYVIGHPCGLPIKFADGAKVRSNSEAEYFTANLDTYGGNSGSPVFNSLNHQVEGILVRGERDFVPLGPCMVSTVCSTNGCRGEDCTRVTEFTDLL